MTITVSQRTIGGGINYVDSVTGLSCNIDGVVLIDPATGNPYSAASGGGGGASTIADGADVNQGSTTDAAVTTDVNGTVSAKLRGLVKMISDAWDSTNHVINVGGKAAAGSAPAANPLSVAGIDGGGLKRHLLTDTTGKLSTIQADGNNATMGAIADAAVVTDANGTLSAKLRGIVKLLAGTLTVSGTAYTAQLAVQRTADTSPYLAGDVIGTGTGSGGAVLTFTNMGLAAGHVIITDVDLRIDLSAVTSGMTSFRLHLYNATPPSALADNAVWDLPSGDRSAYLGYIDLGTPVDVGSTLFVQTSAVNKKLLMGSGTSLYGYMVTNGPYTPGSGDNFSIRLNAVGV